MNKLSMLSRNAAARAEATVNAATPQRPSSAQPVAPRQFTRVLQSGRAPAQLSLFLRPGNVR
jgi:hypothetical protein